MNCNELKKKIEDCHSMDDFNKTFKNSIKYENLLREPPRSPEQAYLAMHLAIERKTNLSFCEDLKAQWQRYWLRCCLSDKCNYDFSVLKECGINREKDVKTIVKESLKDDGILEKHIGSDEGIKFYKQTIADWFLRRYNGKEAKEILSPFGCWDKLKLCYPRLVVAIIIGLIVVAIGKEGWDLPHHLSYKISDVIYGIFLYAFNLRLPSAYSDIVGTSGLLFISIILLYISYKYLTYECYNIIMDKREASKRASSVCLKGLVVSIFFSIIICSIIGSISVDKNIVQSYYMVPFFRNIIFFASTSLFIGIFIQVFWEKETITEPL